MGESSKNWVESSYSIQDVGRGKHNEKKKKILFPELVLFFQLAKNDISPLLYNTKNNSAVFCMKMLNNPNNLSIDT